MWLFYFGMTTMSTVGFGDFAPKSNEEMLFTSFWMLFGVAIFSIIMNQIIEIINEIYHFDRHENSSMLDSFFKILRSPFNGGEAQIQFQKQLEAYF